MKTTFQTGKFAEKTACWFLRFKGYRLIERNFKVGRGTGAGEIDLIMRKGKTLVFVEVKARQTLETAAESILLQQRIRTTKASAVFLQKNPQFKNHAVRYDAVLIAPKKWPKHIQDAWRIL